MLQLTQRKYHHVKSLGNGIKHALRVLPVIAAAAKVSYKHEILARLSRKIKKASKTAFKKQRRNKNGNIKENHKLCQQVHGSDRNRSCRTCTVRTEHGKLHQNQLRKHSAWNRNVRYGTYPEAK